MRYRARYLSEEGDIMGLASVLREEGREEGIEQGMQKGMQKGALQLWIFTVQPWQVFGRQ